jgi:hypothetical protein
LAKIIHKLLSHDMVFDTDSEVDRGLERLLKVSTNPSHFYIDGPLKP